MNTAITSFRGPSMAIAVLEPTPSSALERLVDDYLTNCKARGLSPRTVSTCYGHVLNRVFLPWCRSQSIEDVSALDGRAVDRFTSWLLTRERDGKPLSRHTVHSYVRPVRQMLTWAEHVGEAVVAKPQLPRLTQPPRDVLHSGEVDSMENAMMTERDRLVIRVLADCGLRLSEFTALTPGSILRSGRQAHLRVQGKGNRWRDVPVPPALLRRIERCIDGRSRARSADRIWLSRRLSDRGTYDPLTTSGVYQIVKDAAARSGIEKRVHPHVLRHSWITEMLRRGMNPVQLSVIAGTSLQVIMEHYQHLSKEDAYDAMLRTLAVRTSDR